MRIGCCVSSKTYETAARMGYDYAELSGRDLMSLHEDAFQSFLKLAQKTGFPVLGINDFCGADHPIVGPKADLKRSAAYMEAVCRRAAALGASRIGVGAPTARLLKPYLMSVKADARGQTASCEISKAPCRDHAESSPDKNTAAYQRLYERADLQMEEYLLEMCRIAKSYGITLLLEAVHDRMCDYLTHTKEAVSMVQRLKLPNLRLVYDFYHAKAMGEGLMEMKKALPYTVHLHYSTDLGKNDRGFVTKEVYGEFKAFLTMAALAGYDGTVSVEANGAYLDRDGSTCAELMRQAAEAASLT